MGWFIWTWACLNTWCSAILNSTDYTVSHIISTALDGHEMLANYTPRSDIPCPFFTMLFSRTSKKNWTEPVRSFDRMVFSLRSMWSSSRKSEIIGPCSVFRGAMPKCSANLKILVAKVKKRIILHRDGLHVKVSHDNLII